MMQTNLTPEQAKLRCTEVANELAHWINDLAPKDLDIHQVYNGWVLLCSFIEAMPVADPGLPPPPQEPT